MSWLHRRPHHATPPGLEATARKALGEGYPHLQNLLQEVRIKRASEMLDPLSRSVLGWRDDREPSRRGYVREHRHSFSTLWVAQINFHSASHARSPRRANLLAPRASLIWPNTGSTIPALLA